MAIDPEKIKDALDKFEDDDFLGSKEVLQQEIKSAVADRIKDKTGINGKDSSDDAEE